MNYEKGYKQKLNFKAYEKTNCFAYELIMRNKDCQNNIKLLHKTIVSINDIGFICSKLFKRDINNNIIKEYINNQMKLDEHITVYENLESDFLKEIINYIIVLKGSYENSEFTPLFVNYVQKKEQELFKNEYIKYQKFVDSIKDLFSTMYGNMQKSELEPEGLKYAMIELCEILIRVLGYTKLKKENELIDCIYIPEDEVKLFEIFQENILLRTMQIGKHAKHEIDTYKKTKEEIFDIEMDRIYVQYKKTIKKINRLEKLRYKIESYLSKEFYLDFDNKLFLEYEFFTDKLKKDIKLFYENLMQRKEYQLGTVIDSAYMQEDKFIESKKARLKISEGYALDKNLMQKLNSIHIEENLSATMSINPNNDIYSSRDVVPIYSRPSLFSERFRNISFTFNPNLSLNELESQFSEIVTLYQNNALQTRSIYELIGENFNVWSNKIHRQKREHKQQKQKVDSKYVKTLLDNIPEIMFIYDADKNGISHTVKKYETGLGDGTISTYSNFAKYLIEEKGYKVLLTANG